MSGGPYLWRCIACSVWCLALTAELLEERVEGHEQWGHGIAPARPTTKFETNRAALLLEPRMVQAMQHLGGVGRRR